MYSLKKRSYNQAASRRAASRRINSMRRAGTISVRRNIGGLSTRSPAVLRATTAEIKSCDVPSSSYTINSGGTIQFLNLIRVGSTFCNRIGRRIEMKNIRMSGILQYARTNASEDYLRIMLVYDRQTNGNNPAISDILQSTDQSTTNTTGALSGMNVNNRDRFKILRDMRIYAPSFTDTGGLGAITNVAPPDPMAKTYKIEEFVKLGGMVTQYKSDSVPASIGDIATGGLMLITIGTQGPGTEGYSALLEFRLRYNDV